MQVLREHPAVLDDPEPLVLVDELGSSTVNLRVYLWVNAHQLSGFKVKSSVIRQVISKLEESGVSMPDDAREVVFPDSVPVRMLPDHPTEILSSDFVRSVNAETRSDEQISNSAEGDLGSEAKELNEQARKSRDPEDDTSDLLNDTPSNNVVKSETDAQLTK